MATLTLPNGTNINIPDNLSEEEKQKIIDNNSNYEQNFEPDLSGNEGLLSDAPDALKNNWLYDNLVVAHMKVAEKP